MIQPHLNQWKEIILKFLFDSGLAAEVLTIFEFQNMEEEWSSLPRDDLIEIIDTLVDEGHARWIGDKEAVTFKV